MFEAEGFVLIVILNYNSGEDTVSCIKSVFGSVYNKYHISVIDNASTDDSLRYILRYLDEVRRGKYKLYESPTDAFDVTEDFYEYTIIKSGFNGGYGYGNNIGIKYSLIKGYQYVMIINNDTVVDKYFLFPLIMMCERDKDIGIVSGKIYFYDKPNIIWFNGGYFMPKSGKVIHCNYNEEDVGQSAPDENTFITGCMWLIPTKVIRTVGYINEDYFMYVEDLEYSQRVLNAGFKLKVNELSNIWHKVGGSSYEKEGMSKLSMYYTARNKLIFLKSGNFELKVKLLPYIRSVLYEPLRMIIKGVGLKYIKAYLLGLMDFKKVGKTF